MSRRSWRDRVRDILDAAQEIRHFTKGMDFDGFAADARTQKAVLADFGIIGEAARHVPADVTDAHPDVPWRAMREMRNVVVHAYFHVDPRIVWDTIDRDLPDLVGRLEQLLAGDSD